MDCATLSQQVSSGRDLISSDERAESHNTSAHSHTVGQDGSSTPSDGDVDDGDDSNEHDSEKEDASGLSDRNSSDVNDTAKQGSHEGRARERRARGQQRSAERRRRKAHAASPVAAHSAPLPSSPPSATVSPADASSAASTSHTSVATSQSSATSTPSTSSSLGNVSLRVNTSTTNGNNSGDVGGAASATTRATQATEPPLSVGAASAASLTPSEEDRDSSASMSLSLSVSPRSHAAHGAHRSSSSGAPVASSDQHRSRAPTRKAITPGAEMHSRDIGAALHAAAIASSSHSCSSNCSSSSVSPSASSVEYVRAQHKHGHCSDGDTPISSSRSSISAGSSSSHTENSANRRSREQDEPSGLPITSGNSTRSSTIEFAAENQVAPPNKSETQENSFGLSSKLISDDDGGSQGFMDYAQENFLAPISDQSSSSITKSHLLRVYSFKDDLTYWTIPVTVETTAFDCLKKIQEKLDLENAFSTVLQLYERSGGIDRPVHPTETLLLIQNSWKDQSCRFVLREFAKTSTKIGSGQQSVDDGGNRLRCFLPDYVINRYLFVPHPPAKPERESFPAAVMFVDISGFTSFTEQLLAQGESGTEELTQHLNTFFTHLIDVIKRHQGDIIQFGGDSILMIWESPLVTPQHLTVTACRCGLEIQNVFANYYTSNGTRLQLYVAISAGEMNSIHVGEPGNWQIVFVGEPVTQISRIMPFCNPREIVMSVEAWNVLGNLQSSFKVSRKGVASNPSRSRMLGVFGIGNKNTQPKPVFGGKTKKKNSSKSPVDPNAPYLLGDQGELPTVAVAPGVEQELSSRVNKCLRAYYLSQAVLSRLDQGLVDWVGELRPVTTMFVNLPSLDDFLSDDFMPQLQLCTLTIQQEIIRWNGTINKFIMDDKGTLLLCAFGLPPQPSNHKALRAVNAALNIYSSLFEKGIESTIGITTGRNFCGLIGGQDRQEYTIMGDSVNMAARLMKYAKSILVDLNTYRASAAAICYETVENLKLKGKAERVTCYRPMGSTSEHTQLDLEEDLQMDVEDTECLGREVEQASIMADLTAFCKSGEQKLIFVEGEQGIGKSVLLHHVKRAAIATPNVHVLFSQCREPSVLYPFRSLLRQIMGFQEMSIAAQEAYALKHFEQTAPLLNPLLNLNIPETSTLLLPIEERKRRLVDLTIEILRMSAGPDSGILLIIDDCNIMDYLSWCVVQQLVKKQSGFMVILASRPGTRNDIYNQLSHTALFHLLQLQTPAESVTLAIVCNALGVEKLPVQVEEIIVERGQGNPLFSIELGRSLREMGLILLHDGICEVSPDVSDLTSKVPETLNGVIMTRIDTLSCNLQLTLKVASVVGRTFSLPVLSAVHPIDHTARSDIESQARILEQCGLIERVPLSSTTAHQGAARTHSGDHVNLAGTSESNVFFRFKHSITRQVAYNSMLFSQRRHIHRSIAEYYEALESPGGDLLLHLEALAFHWERAGEIGRALVYLPQAGNLTLARNDTTEAIKFFTKALDLADKLDREEISHNQLMIEAYSQSQTEESVTAAQLGHLETVCPYFVGQWKRKLGEAYLQENTDNALTHLAEAAHFLDRDRGAVIVSAQSARRVLNEAVLSQLHLLRTEGQNLVSVFGTSMPGMFRSVRNVCWNSLVLDSNFRVAAAAPLIAQRTSLLAHTEAALQLVKTLELQTVERPSKTNKKRTTRKGATEKTTLSDDEPSCQDPTTLVENGLTGMSIRERVLMLADATYVCLGLGQVGLAGQLRDRALNLVSQIHDEYAFGYIVFMSSFVSLSQGDLKECERYLGKCSRTVSNVSTPAALRLARAAQEGLLRLFMHRCNTRRVFHLLEEYVGLLPEKDQNAYFTYHTISAWYHLSKNDVKNAKKVLHALVPSLQFYNECQHLEFFGLLAQLFLYEGEFGMAMRALEDGMSLRERIHLYPPNICATILPLPEVLFALASHSSPLCKQARKLLSLSIRHLRKAMEPHPLFAPRLAIFHGRYLWSNNKPRKAMKHWLKGLQLAEESKHSYDIALLKQEIGAHPAGVASRLTYLEEASQIFEQIGAISHHNLALSLLQNEAALLKEKEKEKSGPAPASAAVSSSSSAVNPAGSVTSGTHADRDRSPPPSVNSTSSS